MLASTYRTCSENLPVYITNILLAITLHCCCIPYSSIQSMLLDLTWKHHVTSACASLYSAVALNYFHEYVLLLPRNISIYIPASFYTAHVQVNDSECNSIELTITGSGHIVRGYAVLDGPIISGRITFVGSCMTFYEVCTRQLHAAHFVTLA